MRAGSKCSPPGVPVSTGTGRTRCYGFRGTGHEDGRGVQASLDLCARTMDAGKPTPRSGENVSEEQFDWETVGRELLSRELERRAARIQSAFQHTAKNLREGREWTDEDVRQVNEAAQEAKRLADILWKGGPTAQTYAELLEEREEGSEE